VNRHFEENYFYCSNLSASELHLDEEESKHAIKVLRLTIGDTIFVTDGNGHLSKCLICGYRKDSVLLDIVDDKIPEPAPVFTLAVSITKKPALETMIEMCGQLSIKTIIPFSSEHSCKQSDYLSKSVKRLDEKLKSALKQSKKSYLTRLERETKFTTILDMVDKYDATAMFEILGAEQNSENIELIKKAKTILVIIGPEGGFSKREIAMAKEMSIPVYSLGENRLRAETAAFASIVKLSAIRIAL
jgi:16S rRNA (uracil1498-N3)-methyltransferase